MKCKKCSKTAVIRLIQHNTAFCAEHFIEYFEKCIQRTITEYSMIQKDDRVLVAVSGGKDSMTLWYVLNKLGYKTSGLLIDTGIGELKSNVISDFAVKMSRELMIVDVKEYLSGLTTPEVAKLIRRPTCSVCGLIRRYLMNKVAYENGYDLLVTGHNLDDEVSFLLGNLLNWNLEYLQRQAPFMPKTHKRIVAKAKPLVWLTEKEIYVYAMLNEIPFESERCPFSKDASSLRYKSLLNRLEIDQPGTKLRFYKQFQRLSLFQRDAILLNECVTCGYPTTTDKCSFCRMRERIENAMGEQAN
ncbi:TIGR00269 family protein [Pseudothermotoga sp. U03pept]|uniref:TIGR00269 family protein n=1 Tax=Pseudothermotoga sp. U03pept TaxID=3447012 RepID=UPI003F11D0A8